MAQNEIIDFLKKHPDVWFSTKNISDALNIKPDRVRPALKRLVLWDFVLRTVTESGVPFYKYRGSIQWP